MQRPERNEYVDYYHAYVGKVPDGDILEILEQQRDVFTEFLSGIGEEKANHRYAPEKWSVKGVAGHIIDVERVFAVRALAFARCDKTPLPSFEQDDYAAQANFDERPIADIIDEFRAVRAATLTLFRSFRDEYWTRTGTASGFEFSTRAIPYILAGHLKHHKMVIEERYL